jgi:phosphoglycerol transferase
MTSLKSLTFNTKIFYALLLGVFIAILMRNSALYPSVFADEYTYSISSRVLPLSEAAISNYLYLLIFRLTNVCGDGFLSCARILNLVFFFGAIPFIYQIAKKVSSRSVARWICLLTVIGPINLYTAFFMPEALYFLTFWVYAWYLLSIEDDVSIKQAMIVGILAGLSSLIKPHGIFLIIPTFLYFIFLLNTKTRKVWERVLLITLVIFVSFIAIKFIVGYLIAGKTALNLLGNTYSATTSDFLNAVANDSTPETIAQESLISKLKYLFISIVNFDSNFWNFIRLWLTNLQGHLISLCLLFAIPLCLGLKALYRHRGENDTKIKAQLNLIVFSLIFIFFLIFLSSLYSGLMGQASGERLIFRLHERYYNFAFPLFYILIASVFAGNYLAEKSDESSERFLYVVFVVAMSGIILYGALFFTRVYQPTSIDSPELFGITSERSVLFVISFFSICVLLASVFYSRVAGKFYLLIIAPIYIAISTIYVNVNMWQKTLPDLYDRSGIIAKNILTTDELKKLVIVGDNPIELSRTAFYLDVLPSYIQIIKGGSIYSESSMPPGIELALVLDGHAIDKGSKNIRRFDEFSLVGGGGNIAINFPLSRFSSEEIAYLDGVFMPPEVWGTWSIGKFINIDFKKRLPEKFTITLEARAYAKNVNKDFIVHIGSYSQKFRVGNKFDSIKLLVENPNMVNRISIEVPMPTSPKSLGEVEDERELGIAIRGMAISW